MERALAGAIALAAATFAGQAMAQTTMIITQEPETLMAPPLGPPVMVDDGGPPDRPATTGTLTRNGTGAGCASTVTRHDDIDGTTTAVRQERCTPLR